MAQLNTVTISIDDLRVGATCSHPVEGDGGVLLLGARSRISQQIIAGLRERGIDSIEGPCRVGSSTFLRSESLEDFAGGNSSSSVVRSTT